MQEKQTKLTWADKLANIKGLPKIVKKARKKMLIPSPKEVNTAMGKVKKGKLATANSISKQLAKKYKTDTCCPLTTAIFIWISANVANEQKIAGKKNITPYWRTIKSDGTLNSKYPGGELAHAKMLISEGHKIIKKAKKMVVVDFEKKI